MPTIQDCLKTAIGLSQRDCNCFDPKPTGWNVSESGLFIDSIDEGVPLEFPAGTAGCGEGGVWDMLERARVAGIQEFIIGFLTTTMRNAGNSIVPTRGEIGDNKNDTALIVNNPVVGFALKFKTMRGAACTINGISMTMAGAATFTVKVFRSDGDYSTPIFSQAITTLNNKKTTFNLTSPWVLPFTDDLGNPYTYHVVYERTSGILPRNNVFNCGCGSQIRHWDPYLQRYKGFALTSWGDLNENVDGYDDFTYGIQLDTSFSCDATKWICINKLQYQTDGFAAVIAKAIQLYSVNKLLGGILNSTAINRFTLLPKDGIISRLNANNKSLEAQMIWLGQNMHTYASSMTDCFTCKADNVFVKQEILV